MCKRLHPHLIIRLRVVWFSFCSSVPTLYFDWCFERCFENDEVRDSFKLLCFFVRIKWKQYISGRFSAIEDLLAVRIEMAMADEEFLPRTTIWGRCRRTVLKKLTNSLLKISITKAKKSQWKMPYDSCFKFVVYLKYVIWRNWFWDLAELFVLFVGKVYFLLVVSLPKERNKKRPLTKR